MEHGGRGGRPLTAIRRFLPSGALLVAEIVVPDRVPVWLDAICDRYPDPPDPSPLGESLLALPLFQGIDSYLMTRWIDGWGAGRIITRKVGSRSEPGPHLEAHEAEVTAFLASAPPACRPTPRLVLSR